MDILKTENNEKINKKRVKFIDIAKGISILLMIIGHVLEMGIIRSIIFSFHMPLYIITSGYFYKDKPFKVEIKNLVINLLIPTTIIIFIISLIKNISQIGLIDSCFEALKTITVCWSHKSKIDYSFSDTGVLWFIYMLIGIRLLFKVNKKIAKDNELFLFIIILFETYIGYLIGISGYWLPWSVDVTLACVLFYYVGYILGKYNILKEICSNYWIILILLLVWILGIKFNWIEIAVRSYPNGLWSYLVAISGTILVFKIAMFIESKMYILSNFFEFCGINSLYVLFGHYIEWQLFKYNINIKNKELFKFILISLKLLFTVFFAFLISNIKRIVNKTLKKENMTKVILNS